MRMFAAVLVAVGAAELSSPFVSVSAWYGCAWSMRSRSCSRVPPALIQSSASPLGGRPGSSSTRTLAAMPCSDAPTMSRCSRPAGSLSANMITCMPRRNSACSRVHFLAPPALQVAIRSHRRRASTLASPSGIRTTSPGAARRSISSSSSRYGMVILTPLTDQVQPPGFAGSGRRWAKVFAALPFSPVMSEPSALTRLKRTTWKRTAPASSR